MPNLYKGLFIEDDFQIFDLYLLGGIAM